jgi:hypothetical protein
LPAFAPDGELVEADRLGDVGIASQWLHLDARILLGLGRGRGHAVGSSVAQRGRPQEREDGEWYERDQCRAGDATAIAVTMAVPVVAVPVAARPAGGRTQPGDASRDAGGDQYQRSQGERQPHDRTNVRRVRVVEDGPGDRAAEPGEDRSRHQPTGVAAAGDGGRRDRAAGHSLSPTRSGPIANRRIPVDRRLRPCRQYR